MYVFFCEKAKKQKSKKCSSCTFYDYVNLFHFTQAKFGMKFYLVFSLKMKFDILPALNGEVAGRFAVHEDCGVCQHPVKPFSVEKGYV